MKTKRLYELSSKSSILNDITYSFLQDRHVKRNAVDMEPVVDPAQDYVLIAGYENVTHTVMRFQRKLDTCDATYDIPISVSFPLLQSSQKERIWSPANVNEFKCSAKKSYVFNVRVDIIVVILNVAVTSSKTFLYE